MEEEERKGGGGGGDVSTDNKPVLICSPIRAIKLNGSSRGESAGPSGLLSDPPHLPVLLCTLEEEIYLKSPLTFVGHHFSTAVQQIFKSCLSYLLTENRIRCGALTIHQLTNQSNLGGSDKNNHSHNQ